jgi:hypothetical protein
VFHRYAIKIFCFKSAVGHLQDENGAVTADSEHEAHFVATRLH